MVALPRTFSFVLFVIVIGGLLRLPDAARLAFLRPIFWLLAHISLHQFMRQYCSRALLKPGRYIGAYRVRRSSAQKEVSFHSGEVHRADLYGFYDAVLVYEI